MQCPYPQKVKVKTTYKLGSMQLRIDIVHKSFRS